MQDQSFEEKRKDFNKDLKKGVKIRPTKVKLNYMVVGGKRAPKKMLPIEETALAARRLDRLGKINYIKNHDGEGIIRNDYPVR